MTKQTIIGLTGGIGAGKSTVAMIFKALGVPVFNSDIEAKRIVNTDKEVIASIKKVFGEDVYLHNVLDSKKIADLAFTDKTVLHKLNGIIHPKVKEAFDKWIKNNPQEKVLIKEAAILIETGNYQDLDKLILVVAPKEVKVTRVMNRDGVDSVAVTNRMNAQLPDVEKQKVADFIIHNNDEQLVIPQVLSIYKQLNELLVQ
ncbi:MAG: dephospho-CoA kinase [Vicingus serpentipes]|nr:dephospho-CoA kinase [Vicingus serpentipes]